MILLTAALALGLLAAIASLVRHRARADFHRAPLATRVDRINQLLPQTQCEQCGYPGCKPYATAIAEGAAEINQCPPGGERGIQRLASLLGREALPLNPANGIAKTVPTVARIEEDICIGCMKCIQACPVDAIVGANQLMHTVITAQCTGCELCLPPCPVDCIVMEPAIPAAKPSLFGKYHREHEERRFADLSRQRYESRQARLAREAAAAETARRRRRESLTAQSSDAVAQQQDPVAAALARARAKKAAAQSPSVADPDGEA